MGNIRRYNTRFINGKEVKEFEAAFAAFCGTEYAVGVGSGTDALILALRGLGIGQGDEVITTPHTFIATAEAILAVNAKPVFVDIDEATYNIDPAKIEEKITDRTRAILPVSLYGNPAPMGNIFEIAKKYSLKVLGDAAQAHGAELNEKNIAQWGEAACFSFYPGKNLGAYGDAGAVVTRDAELAEKLSLLKDHGRRSKYEHLIIGVNSRLDTLQAAILRVKLRYLPKWNEARRSLANYYREQVKDLPVICPTEVPNSKHVFHLFVIRTANRDRLQQYLKGRGIETGIHYPIPLHLQPALQFLGYRKGDFPITEHVATEILSLPMFPELEQKQADRVIESIRSFFTSIGQK